MLRSSTCPCATGGEKAASPSNNYNRNEDQLDSLLSGLTQLRATQPPSPSSSEEDYKGESDDAFFDELSGEEGVDWEWWRGDASMGASAIESSQCNEEGVNLQPSLHASISDPTPHVASSRTTFAKAGCKAARVGGFRSSAGGRARNILGREGERAADEHSMKGERRIVKKREDG